MSLSGPQSSQGWHWPGTVPVPEAFGVSQGFVPLVPSGPAMVPWEWVTLCHRGGLQGQPHSLSWHWLSHSQVGGGWAAVPSPHRAPTGLSHPQHTQLVPMWVGKG